MSSSSDLIVFLDLDFTLACFDPIPGENLELKEGVESFIIEHELSDATVPQTIFKRPHVDEFLKQLSERYDQVHLFTAAGKEYADKVLEKLDPTGTIFCKRWYGDSLTPLAYGEKRKDVLKLQLEDNQKIDPKRFVLIDDNQDYMKSHLRNGILISEFHVGVNAAHKQEEPKTKPKDDAALLQILELLRELENLDDVRPLLDKKFSWELIQSMADLDLNIGATPI